MARALRPNDALDIARLRPIVRPVTSDATSGYITRGTVVPSRARRPRERRQPLDLADSHLEGAYRSAGGTHAEVSLVPAGCCHQAPLHR
jgi:hypothetical protein